MDLNSSPLELKTRADELYANKEYAAAAQEYRKLVDAQPHATSGLKSLGLALVLSNQIEEGIQVCKTAAAMQPADAELRYAYGYALGAANRFDEAITELDAALNLQPNHVPARQGLIYCLLNSGQALADSDPHGAENRLDRAHKLDSKNPHIANTLLNFYVKGGQKGKAVKLVQALDETSKSQSPLKETLEALKTQPEFATSLRVAEVASSAAPKAVVAPPAGAQALKQVPCPNCKQPIMDYAAICPHCNFRIRATGTFANRDTGPAYEWQEIAYTIMSLIWIGLAATQGIFAFLAFKKVGIEGIGTFFLVMYGARTLVGLGLLFRQEWIAFIAKILCYITLFTCGYGVMIDLGLKQYLAAGIDALSIAVAGFMVYLINYVMGD